jgi:hypothetical protein
VPFGRGSDLQFLVFDSSWVGVTPIPPADLMYRNYRAQFEQAFALGVRTPRAFFISHHPTLGFASNANDPQNPFPGNGGLQSVLTPMFGNALFPPNVELVLSGTTICSRSSASPPVIRRNSSPAMAATGPTSRSPCPFP